MRLQRNRSPFGRLNNMGFGLCAIGDGLVRLLSCGLLHSTLTLDYARNSAKRHFNRLRRPS